MKKLKVWSGTVMTVHGIESKKGQVPIIIAATSAKQAAEISGVSLSQIQSYFSKTGNATDLAVATRQGVWAQKKRWTDDANDFVEVVLKHYRLYPKDTIRQYPAETLHKFWAAICPECGWRGLSCSASGGGQIADTGDYEDVVCPECGVPLDEDYAVEELEPTVDEGPQIVLPNMAMKKSQA